MNERIFTWLQELSPELAESYAGAVKLIEDASIPGRGRFICHAVREIRNRLPDKVAGKLDIERLEYKYEVEVLAKGYTFEASLKKVACFSSRHTGNWGLSSLHEWPLW